MIPAIVTAAAGVVVGLFVGGCTNGGDEISKQLMHRNAQLENQLTGAHATLTGLAVSAVILAAGLGASIYGNRKAGKRGEETGRRKPGK
jgi:outer membrane lipoprotein-sorting protein